MRHLLEFNQFEGQENEIRECFIELLEEYNDVDFSIKLSNPNPKSLFQIGHLQKSDIRKIKKNMFIVSIGFSRYCGSEANAESEYGIRYRPVNNGQELANIVASGVSKMTNFHDMEVIWASVNWVNAGEWPHNNPDKNGSGPGLLERTFRINDLKVDELPEFISQMGDRLRNIKIYVTKR